MIRTNLRLTVFGIAAIFILLMLSNSNIYAQQSNDTSGDNQFWPDTQANIRMGGNLSLILYGTLRLGRQDTAFVNEQAGIGINRIWGKYLTSSIQYRFINSEPTPDRISHEHRLFADATPRIFLPHRFALTDRNRIEWRDVNNIHSWRYRNRLQIERGMAVKQIKITPYVSVESYYDTRFKAWSRTQLYSGARIPIIKHVTLDAFYMRQWDARVKPGFLHVAGAFWKLEF